MPSLRKPTASSRWTESGWAHASAALRMGSACQQARASRVASSSRSGCSSSAAAAFAVAATDDASMRSQSSMVRCRTLPERQRTRPAGRSAWTPAPHLLVDVFQPAGAGGADRAPARLSSASRPARQSSRSRRSSPASDAPAPSASGGASSGGRTSRPSSSYSSASGAGAGSPRAIGPSRAPLAGSFFLVEGLPKQLITKWSRARVVAT